MYDNSYQRFRINPSVLEHTAGGSERFSFVGGMLSTPAKKKKCYRLIDFEFEPRLSEAEHTAGGSERLGSNVAVQKELKFKRLSSNLTKLGGGSTWTHTQLAEYIGATYPTTEQTTTYFTRQATLWNNLAKAEHNKLIKDGFSFVGGMVSTPA